MLHCSLLSTDARAGEGISLTHSPVERKRERGDYRCALARGGLGGRSQLSPPGGARERGRNLAQAASDPPLFSFLPLPLLADIEGTKSHLSTAGFRERDVWKSACMAALLEASAGQLPARQGEPTNSPTAELLLPAPPQNRTTAAAVGGKIVWIRADSPCWKKQSQKPRRPLKECKPMTRSLRSLVQLNVARGGTSRDLGRHSGNSPKHSSTRPYRAQDGDPHCSGGGGERTVNSQRKLTTGQEKQDTVLAAVQQQEDSRTRKGALEKSQVQHFSSYVHSREHPERANRVLTTGQLEVLPVWYNPS